MEKNILDISDPRDAFMIMLLERLAVCEDTVRELKKTVVVLEEKNKRLFVRSDKFQSYQCVGGVELAITCSDTCVEDGKMDLENCCRLLVETFGTDNLKSLSAVMTLDDRIPCGYACCTRLYLNFKRHCWIHELTRTIEDMKFPEHIGICVSVKKGIYAYCDHAEDKFARDGIVYSLFDLNGVMIPEPKWIEWEKVCPILGMGESYFSDYGSDDEWVVEQEHDD
jgi:hypothetical protein